MDGLEVIVNILLRKAVQGARHWVQGKLLYGRAMLHRHDELLLNLISAEAFVLSDIPVHHWSLGLCHAHSLLTALVVALNSSLDWAAHRARLLLALAVVRKNIARAHTVRCGAVLVLATHDMLPQDLHTLAMLRHRALASSMGALACMAQQQKPLLLLLQDLPAVLVVLLTT